MKNIIDNIIKNIDIDNVTWASLTNSFTFSIGKLHFSFYSQEHMLTIYHEGFINPPHIDIFLSTDDAEKLRNKFLEHTFIFNTYDEKKVLKELEKLC